MVGQARHTDIHGTIDHPYTCGYDVCSLGVPGLTADRNIDITE
jgi:hypothetical protein